MDEQTLAKLRSQADGKPVMVMAVDLETGEEEIQFTDKYVLTVVSPYELAYENHYQNGTTMLTVKRQQA